MSSNFELMSVKDAADRIGVTDARVRQMILAGDARAMKIGHQWVLTSDEVDRLSNKDRGNGGRPRISDK